MSESKVTYGNIPADVADALSSFCVAEGLSYQSGQTLMQLLAENWPGRGAITLVEHASESHADAAFRANNAENTIKNARMQLAALLKQPIEAYENLSLGGMINCLATKVAFPHPNDLPPKLQEQFIAQSPAAFVVEESDACEQAILRLLMAHKFTLHGRWMEAKRVAEILQASCNKHWTRGYIIRELTRLSELKKIVRCVRPGLCCIYRAK